MKSIHTRAISPPLACGHMSIPIYIPRRHFHGVCGGGPAHLPVHSVHPIFTERSTRLLCVASRNHSLYQVYGCIASPTEGGTTFVLFFSLLFFTSSSFVLSLSKCVLFTVISRYFYPSTSNTRTSILGSFLSESFFSIISKVWK